MTRRRRRRQPKPRSARATGDRAHRPGPRHVALVVAFTLVMAFVSQWLEFRGWESGFETSFKDFLLVHPFDGVLSPGTSEGDPRIAIVAIDDASYTQCFDPPNVLTPGTVLQMLTHLRKELAGDTQVVAIDLLTDAAGYEQSEAARDEQSILGPRKPSYVYATGAAPRASEERFWSWLMTDAPPDYLVEPTSILGKPLEIGVPFTRAGGEESWGVPTYPTDHDGVLRRLPHGVQLTIDAPGRYHPTFAGAVAAAIRPGAVEREDVYMDFSDWRPSTWLRTFSASDLFSCRREGLAPTQPAAVQVSVGPGMNDFKRFNGRIVLLGATYENARDRHDTPRGPMSGVELNAYAIRSKMGDRTVTEVAPRWMLLIEWLGACLVLLVPRFVPEGKWRKRAEVWIRVVAFLAFGFAGLLLHSIRSMWPGVIWAYEYVWDWIKDRTPLSPEWGKSG